MTRKSIFPPYALSEALVIAKTIWDHNAGQPMRRITLFDALNRQPESGSSRALITASSGYGLTQGSYTAEVISLTDQGRAIVEQDDTKAKLDAVLQVDIFRVFLEKYRDATIPSQAAARDFLKSQGVPEQSVTTCLDIFLKTAKQVGLIQEISGRERILSPEYVLEQTGSSSNGRPSAKPEIGDGSDVTTPESQTLEDPLPSQTIKPTLHIDVQIHIASDASTQQIDQIFASMAKHLYNKG